MFIKNHIVRVYFLRLDLGENLMNNHLVLNHIDVFKLVVDALQKIYDIKRIGPST